MAIALSGSVDVPEGPFAAPVAEHVDQAADGDRVRQAEGGDRPAFPDLMGLGNRGVDPATCSRGTSRRAFTPAGEAGDESQEAVKASMWTTRDWG